MAALYHGGCFVIALQDLIAATGGRLIGGPNERTFVRFCYDSRIAGDDELFVAVVTETGDGHDYVEQACASGARGVLCQRVPRNLCAGVSYLLVDDTQIALRNYARYILQRREIAVIAVAGSVGKTSTKQAIVSALRDPAAVLGSRGNFSGRFGLPIALGELLPSHRTAILEFACDSLGEMATLARMTRPRLAVITRLGPAYLDMFGNPERFCAEHRHLLQSLPADGCAVLNVDDPAIARLAKDVPCRVLRYGSHPDADLVASNIEPDATGVRLTVRWQGQAHWITIPLLGAHHAETALAALATGCALGVEWDALISGLERMAPLPGRTRLLPALNGANLIDDSYDATPQSVHSAIETLAGLAARERIAVLGDMPHLGSATERHHRELGPLVAGRLDHLWLKGDLAALAASEAMAHGMPAERIHVAYANGDIISALEASLEPRDLVLLKGGAPSRLEVVAEALLAQPDTAPQVLARQDQGWRQVRLRRLDRPTWVEIDLEAIAHNVRTIVARVAPAEVMAILKADGYGHGAQRIAHTAVNNGARWLGVACLGEAIALRRTGIRVPILNLGYTPPWQARECVRHDVVATCFSMDVAQALSQAATDLGRTAKVHIKVDTGMGRLGLLPDDLLPLYEHIADLPTLEIDGLFTHFSSADEADLDYTTWQHARFSAVLDTVSSSHPLPPWIHAANSAAILRAPETHHNLVRLGIALYGLAPSSDVPLPTGLRPALTMKSEIAQIKSLPPGSHISYGRTFSTSRLSRIAVIPVGYADGFRRAPTNWGEVLVRGQRAPLVGRVCMDQSMIDVTDIPEARAGDEVVLIGAQGQDHISVEEVAERLGTINYEVVSEILARVPRVVA